MNQQNNDIEKRLADAVDAITPDVLPKILLTLNKGENPTMTNQMNENNENQSNIIEFNEPAARKKAKNPWMKRISGIAAALLLSVGAYSGYANLTPEAVIGFDVNPSIELSVNRNERVLKATALNEDAEIILSDMDLKNVDLDVAVNALIGSMVKNGYISEVKNSILISVDSQNQEKGEKLQQKLTKEVDSLLQGYSLEGAVLSQILTEDTRIIELANTHHISFGKAALIDTITKADDTKTFESLAKLSINDLNLLIGGKNSGMKGIACSGVASASGYIGKDKAKSIAATHAGVLLSELTFVKVKMDCDDGRMVYDLEGYSSKANCEYEFEIDATSGTVLEYDRDTDFFSESKHTQYKNQQHGMYDNDLDDYYDDLDDYYDDIDDYYDNDDDDDDNYNNNQSSTLIGKSVAQTAAFNHAGVSAGNVYDLDTDLDNDDGRSIYEIDFKSGTMEYEYDVDAVTGAVISWHSEIDD